VRSMFVAVLIIFGAMEAFACLCIEAPVPRVRECQKAKTERAALFIGKVERVRSETVLLPPDNVPVKMQVVTFQVSETFGNQPSDAVAVVRDWEPGNGSCGFPFVQGRTYLVDASMGQQDGVLHLDSCGHTGAADAAENLVRFLRATKDSQGAILFGIVKQYVGGKNFVARRNQPLSGAAITVSGDSSGQKTVVTDDTGWYEVRDLEAGEYTVRLSVGPGCSTPSKERRIDLSINDCAQVDFRAECAAEQ